MLTCAYRRLARLLAICTALFLAIMAVPAAERFPFEIKLVPVEIPAMPGLHSYAFGQHEGLWVLVGGRLDGLHARQPFRSFPASANNTSVFVVDPHTVTVWSASVLGLPASISEQLQSTNMNFHQSDTTLFIIGGYGYSESTGDHVTHPYLAALDLPRLIREVQTGAPLTAIRQVRDESFAVTGGQLGKLGDELLLVGGHRFDGRYNPMSMPTFRQEYTNAIRVFSVGDTGGDLDVRMVREYTDPDHLRRRDYNLVPQRRPDGSAAYLLSSGVFQTDADLPFLYPVEITATGYRPIEQFDQLLSHYHSPKLPLFDDATREMHTVFFGGIAQYYLRDGSLIRDDLVPFVDTISRVTRAVDGTYVEYVVPLAMPGLIGASGEFIPNPELLRGDSRVIHTADLPDAPVIVGHIVGGIRSPERNPFSVNRTHLTAADASVYAVVMTPRPSEHATVPHLSNARAPR